MVMMNSFLPKLQFSFSTGNKLNHINAIYTCYFKHQPSLRMWYKHRKRSDKWLNSKWEWNQNKWGLAGSLWQVFKTEEQILYLKSIGYELLDCLGYLSVQYRQKEVCFLAVHTHMVPPKAKWNNTKSTQRGRKKDINVGRSLRSPEMFSVSLC